MKFLFLFLFAIISFKSLSADEVNTTLYTGTINNRAITLYLNQQPNPCGGETGFLYQGIYQYGKGKNWIELEISDNGKGNFCMTEFRFTGVLILKKEGALLTGLWISPDGKTQFPISLKKQVLSLKTKAEMEQNLERTHYSNHDC